MATEDIRVEDGRILVDRIGTKTNVDVAASDVDSVTFVRSGDPTGDGSIILHTNDGDVVIRVANDDAGKVLKLVRDAGTQKDDESAKATVAPKRTTATK